MARPEIIFLMSKEKNMSKSKALLLPLALSIGGLMLSPANAAPAATPIIKVRAIQDGYVVDRMLVFPGDTTANRNPIPLTNPNLCPIITNGYIINEADPVRKTSYDMLINAQVWSRNVQFVIDGCFQGRPRIVSVSLVP
jgi:hypothetical protein